MFTKDNIQNLYLNGKYLVGFIGRPDIVLNIVSFFKTYTGEIMYMLDDEGKLYNWSTVIFIEDMNKEKDNG